MKKIDFLSKKIAILGYGIENRALLVWFAKHGAKKVTICDKDEKIQSKLKKFPISNFQFPNKFYPSTTAQDALSLSNGQIPKIKFQTGKNYLENLNKFDIIFRTPGIPYLTPEIQKVLRQASGQAKKAGVEISSQIKLFFDLCPAKIVGVTGTKGKGTTASLIFEVLKRNFQFPHSTSSGQAIFNFQTKSKSQKLIASSKKPQVFLGGNIGNPPIDFLDKLTKNDWVVLELSSFQLQDMEKSPNIAVVLDIKSDHLDYHKSQKEYIEAKTNIVRYQSKKDYAVINLDYLTSFRFAEVSPTEDDYYFSRRKSVDLGTYIEWTPKGKGAHFGKIILRTLKKDYEICRTYDITLRGEHNLENICAATTASFLAGASIEAIRKIVPKFKGLEHRLEFVGEIDGVKYYNDSFSTTPDTTIAAIKSFTEPIILIVGGSEKHSDYSNLAKEIVKSRIKTIIAIGVTGQRIVEHVTCNMKHVTKMQNRKSKIKIIEYCKNMKEIVKTAEKESNPGDVVLLSPASASFDMFRNYKDRGEQFKLAVANLRISNV